MADSYYDSNPRTYSLLTNLGGGVPTAPDWVMCRVVSDEDTEFGARGVGVNAAGFRRLRFAVTPLEADPATDPDAAPGGPANPAVEIRIWSPMARAFVPLAEPITFAGVGAGKGYVIDVPNANGSIVGCFVTNAIGGAVAIAVQGYGDV